VADHTGKRYGFGKNPISRRKIPLAGCGEHSAYINVYWASGLTGRCMVLNTLGFEFTQFFLIGQVNHIGDRL
jgi:hypothetical protein